MNQRSEEEIKHLITICPIANDLELVRAYAETITKIVNQVGVDNISGEILVGISFLNLLFSTRENGVVDYDLAIEISTRRLDELREKAKTQVTEKGETYVEQL